MLSLFFRNPPPSPSFLAMQAVRETRLFTLDHNLPILESKEEKGGNQVAFSPHGDRSINLPFFFKKKNIRSDEEAK